MKIKKEISSAINFGASKPATSPSCKLLPYHGNMTRNDLVVVGGELEEINTRL